MFFHGWVWQGRIGSGILVLALAGLAGCGGGGAAPPPPPPSSGGNGGQSGGQGTGPARPFPGDYFYRLQPAIFPLQLNANPSAAAIVPDDALHETFVSDTADNQVAVLDSSDAHPIATISVPSPLGMDVSADGSTLYVGSAMAAFFTVSTTSLQIESRVVWPGASAANGSLEWPFAMADGSVIWGSGSTLFDQRIRSVNALVRWHPDTGQFDAPIALPNQASFSGYSGLPVRTGDRQSLIIPSDGLYIYSLGANAITASYTATSGDVEGAAPDGSIFVSLAGVPDSSSVLQFFNASLQLQGQVTVPTPGDGPVRLVVSPDGKTAYVSDNGAVTAYSTSSHALLGYFEINAPDPFITVLTADSSGALWGSVDGVFKAQVALSPAPPQTIPDFQAGGVMAMANPAMGPAGGGTTVQFLPIFLQDGTGADVVADMQAYFGSLSGLNQMAGSSAGDSFAALTATTPAAAAPGPVAVVLTDANNNPTFLPDAFSYGPKLLWAVPGVVPPAGGSVSFYAFGDLVGGSGGGQIQIGSQTVSLNPSVQATYPALLPPVQDLALAAPANPPGWADVTASSASGSDTLPRGVQYLSRQVVLQRPAFPPYTVAVYDHVRDLFYLAGANSQIGVFDPNAGALASPLTLAGLAAGDTLVSEVLSSDGHYLFAADQQDSNIEVFDLQDPTASKIVPVTLPGAANALVTSMAASADSKLFFCAPAFGVLDLATWTMGPATFQGSACGNGSRAVSSGDGSVLLFDSISPTTRVTNRYQTATGSFDVLPPFATSNYDLALDADGSVMVTQGWIWGGDLQQRVLKQTNGLGSLALNETGSLMYSQDGIYDTHTGRELISLDADQLGTVAIDPAGQQILILNTGGLVYEQLAVVPLAVATVTPAGGAVGATVTVTGSGFVGGTTATLGGVSMGCTVADSEHMSCTVPAVPSGGAPLVLTNPDGQTCHFELAFVAN